MVDRIIILNTGRVRADIIRTKAGIKRGVDVALQAATVSMVKFAEFLLGKSRAKINNRSGNLSTTGVVADPIITPEKIEIQLGFRADYAAQVDKGGEIRPKKGRALAIPQRPILSPAGVARFKSPREEPNLVLIKGKRFLFLIVPPKKRKLVRSDIHWILVPRVRQRGTRYFTRTLNENRQRATPAVSAAIKKRLGG